jgi:hypothetical protein
LTRPKWSKTVGGFPRGNKAETADFFAAYFASFVGNGVHINPPDSFKVSPVSGLTVRIAPGRCFINGYFGWDSEPEEHTFEPDVVAPTPIGLCLGSTLTAARLRRSG